MRRRALAIAILFVLTALTPALGQSPPEVKMKTVKGGSHTRIHCEWLEPKGDKAAHAAAVTAEEVLADDLENSSVFSLTRAWVPGQQPFDIQATVGGQWSVSGNTVKLTGEVRDVPARRPLLVREYRGSQAEWRSLVHAFADDVVRLFTGEPGVAQTRIAFIAGQGKVKELYVMDFDGARLRALTTDQSLALSPAWSPEGSLILFTSYRGGQGPQVFVISSTGGRPYLVSGRPGLNTVASYSPDGRDIVCTLSQDGNPEIYVLDARGGSPRRLTDTRGIDTSPCWSPTGREIAFTSDRSGTPQVYVMDREGGNLRRLTYDIEYTDSPAWSPKGDRIAFVARTGAGFDIYMCRANGADTRLVVSGGSNENPRWSPDGRHLVFASNRDSVPGLYVTDLDDRAPRRLDLGGLRAQSPAWSPRPPGAGPAVNLNQGDEKRGGNR
jgi:TolB protein